MKLLFENWRKYLTEDNSGDTWYHTTHETTADAVEEEGIYTDHGGFVGGFTLGGHWADEIYGMRPVYLSKEPNKSATREYEGVAFEVDIGDDLLLPDLPSLEDHDANKEDDHFWWSDRDEVPEPLQTYMNNQSSTRLGRLCRHGGIHLMKLDVQDLYRLKIQIQIQMMQTN